MKAILSFFSKVLVVVILMIVIAFGSYQGVTYFLTGKFADIKEDMKESDNTGAKAEKTTEAPEVGNEDVESRLLFIDSRDGMHDYIILTLLNVNSNAMDIVLVPENAQVQVGKKIQKKISKKMDGKSGSVEFRDIERVFGQDKYNMIASIMEEILGLKIDQWDHMTADNAIAFMNTAKTVRMNFDDTFSYRDVDGHLQIIEEGEQELDGEQAFAYVSYLDGTASQESNRLERSDTYLEKLLERMFAKKKGSKIVELYEKYTDSTEKRDFEALTNAFKAAKNTDFITYRILQGGEKDDVFVIDSQKAQLQLNTLMKQAASYSADNKLGKDSDDSSDDYSFDEDAGDSKDLSIEIYNAAYVQGIASEWQYYLEDEGYNITLVDTYQQEGPISTTRIYVDKEGIGGDLLKYFSGAEVSVRDIKTGGDIQIYVGTDHTTVGKSE